MRGRAKWRRLARRRPPGRRRRITCRRARAWSRSCSTLARGRRQLARGQPRHIVRLEPGEIVAESRRAGGDGDAGPPPTVKTPPRTRNSASARPGVASDDQRRQRRHKIGVTRKTPNEPLASSARTEDVLVPTTTFGGGAMIDAALRSSRASAGFRSASVPTSFARASSRSPPYRANSPPGVALPSKGVGAATRDHWRPDRAPETAGERLRHRERLAQNRSSRRARSTIPRSDAPSSSMPRSAITSCSSR